jgi:hypothetical protein
MRPQSAALRLLAARLALPDLGIVASEPGSIECYRLTIQYPDARAMDQVATLVRRQSEANAALQVAYRRPNGKVIAYPFVLLLPQFTAFGSSVRRLNFDTLDDAPLVANADLWLLERASGAFHHDILLCPAHVSGVYGQLVALVQTVLPQAVRSLPND